MNDDKALVGFLSVLFAVVVGVAAYLLATGVNPYVGF